MGDYNGSFFISGVTNSNDFPVLDQGGGAYYVGTAPTGQKAFLSKFNIGTGQMQHSTYLRTYGQIVMDVSSTGNVAVASTINTRDRKSTRLNSSHVRISYAVFCLKKKR